MEKSKITSIVIGIIGSIFAFFAIGKDYRGAAAVVALVLILSIYMVTKIIQINKNSIAMKRLNRKMNLTVKAIESYIKLENRFDRIERELTENKAELKSMRGKKYGRY